MNAPSTPSPAVVPTSSARLLGAGLLAGLLVNVVDVPNSAIFVSPGWSRFLAAHGILLNVPLVSAFYLALHLTYGVALAWAYTVFRARFAAGRGTALLSTGFLIAVHRGFGLGMVAMGIMPLGIFLHFSVGMILGSLAGGLAAAAVLDRASPA